MGDFFLNWNETHSNVDESNHGIPIPRSQQTPSFSRSDLDLSMQVNEFDSPCQAPIVPPNSLVTKSNFSMPFDLNFEQSRPYFSPLDSTSPLISSMCDMEDMEIKVEPLEDLLDISGMINSSSELNYKEDNLLDNVNFEDLLMTDEMESSTTCLDPQHSSPAAMAAVHPDDVLGMTRNESKASQQTSFTSSINVPCKSEPFSFGAASLPIQGFGWKDNNIFNLSVSTQHPSNPFQPHSYTCHTNNPRISSFSQSQNEQIFNSNDVPFMDDENAETTNSPTLQNLLINNCSSPVSPQQQQKLLISPKSISPFDQQDIIVGQSVPGPSSFLHSSPQTFPSRLSSSAPVNDFSLEQFWQRREPRTHLLSSGSLAEEVTGSTSSLSTGGGILSPISHDLSIDEGIDSDDDSDGDHYDSDSDDNESIMSGEISVGNSNGKKERHFWQYNVQAKGPKGQRVNIIQKETNPHRLIKIMDPVFSPLCFVQGIKHSGKARRGDGNDLTPSPRKLVAIGKELDGLTQQINEMTPVSDLPTPVRSKSRKEKNKLASRACRLKKKAQHEANKIKLYGLEQEHHGLIILIKNVREDLIKKVIARQKTSSELTSDEFSLEVDDTEQEQLTDVIEKAAKLQKDKRIAGQTTEFINRVIENCRTGNSTGGLEELTRIFNIERMSSPVDHHVESDMFS